MSQHSSSQSSVGVGPSSSPYTTTDPSLYSPDLARYSRPNGFTHRNSISQATITDNLKASLPKTSADNIKNKGILPVPSPCYEGVFTNEIPEKDKSYVSRYQYITHLPDGTGAGADIDHEIFTVQHQMKLYQCFNRSVPLNNRGVHIRYDDLREAAEAKDILTQHGFGVEWISGYEYALAKSQDTAQLNEFEGQAKFSVVVQPSTDQSTFEFTEADLNEVTEMAEFTASVFGTVRSCIHIETHDTKLTLVFRVEFHSVDAATRAVHSLALNPVWGVNKTRTFRFGIIESQQWTGERAAVSPHRTMPRIDDQGRLFGYRAAAAPFVANNHHQRHPADQHNRVRRERILDGSDVRTTIMLRNIPNKLDWLSLKNILDEICFGTYDFMYLRIDFKSACNVGYAFINFADVGGMIALIDNIEGRCWTAYRSSKAAEISYATIQGREALVQKFRNSSVMQETPFCRPRLFLTYADAQLTDKVRLTGTEQPFPRPDNLSKLQRSMDSARSVGLYPPHGYSAVTEHRNRASAYDRGTPRDMMQAATHLARQRAAQLQLVDLTEMQKRDIEYWYYYNHGGYGPGGHAVPFEFIPMSHIYSYVAEHASANSIAVNHPGVIGAPVNGSYRRNTVGSAISTPTHNRIGTGSSYVHSPQRHHF